MEILLNLVWVLVVAAGLACWSLVRQRINDHGGRQLLALLMVLLILFPAISITDDLWAAHNPAEADTVLRRHDDALQLQGVLPHIQPPFLVSQFLPPSPPEWGYADLRHEKLPGCNAPDIRQLLIRPPPVLS